MEAKIRWRHAICRLLSSGRMNHGPQRRKRLGVVFTAVYTLNTLPAKNVLKLLYWDWTQKCTQEWWFQAKSIGVVLFLSKMCFVFTILICLYCRCLHTWIANKKYNIDTGGCGQQLYICTLRKHCHSRGSHKTRWS